MFTSVNSPIDSFDASGGMGLFRSIAQIPNTTLTLSFEMNGRKFSAVEQIGRFVICWNEELTDVHGEFSKKLLELLQLQPNIDAAVARMVNKHCSGSPMALNEIKTEVEWLVDDSIGLMDDHFVKYVDRETFIDQHKHVLLSACYWLHNDGIREMTLSLTASVEYVEFPKIDPLKPPTTGNRKN